MEDNIRRKIELSGSSLKLIAIITMFIDHVGAILIEPVLRTTPSWKQGPILWGFSVSELHRINMVLRLIGRLAFPIFTFLLVEGFLHTRNKKNYLLRLSAFAFLSEIPFDLARSRVFFDFSYQNVYFTLAIGMAVMWGMQVYANSPGKWLSPVAGMGLAILLQSDYSWYGIGLIVIHYLIHQSHKNIGKVVLACWLSAQYTAVLALIPIHWYNGQRGLPLRYIFYWFYPVHLLILYFIAT